MTAAIDLEDEPAIQVPTAAEWVTAMQEPQNLAAIISAQIIDSGVLRDVFLFNKPMDSYAFSMGMDRVVLEIEGRQYPVHSVKSNGISQIGVPSFYKLCVRPDDDAVYRLKDFYAEAAGFAKAEPNFSLQELAQSYRFPLYKRSIESFTVRDEAYHHVSVVGMPEDQFKVTLFEGTMMLHIWDRNFEIESVKHKNGIVVFPMSETIEIYQPYEPAPASKIALGKRELQAEPS